MNLIELIDLHASSQNSKSCTSLRLNRRLSFTSVMVPKLRATGVPESLSDLDNRAKKFTVLSYNFKLAQ